MPPFTFISPNTGEAKKHMSKASLLCVYISIYTWLSQLSPVNIRSCSGLLSVAAIKKKKTLSKINVGRKGFIWLRLSHNSSSQREVRTGLKQELKQQPGRSVIYYLAISGLCSDSFWIQPRPTRLELYGPQVHPYSYSILAQK